MQVSILDGSTFLVCDAAGEVDAGPDQPAGLFYRDMRHLSRWQLRLDGRPMQGLDGSGAVASDEAAFVLRDPARPHLDLLRRRHIGDGLQEELRLDNHSPEPVQIQLTIHHAADFADIFEIRERRLSKAGRYHQHVADDRVVLGYTRGDLRRETTIRAPGATLTVSAAAYTVDLPPGGRWRADIEVSVSTETLRPVPRRRDQPNIAGPLDVWLAWMPRLEINDENLRRTCRQSLLDLAALRCPVDAVPDAMLPAAGLPWYMALFGRDCLLTSYQALPFAPELCRTTLRALAAYQATGFDDFRDAEPGKILHELRYGELTVFGERPHSPYYGSADSTPLFLVVLDEYERWTGDTQTVRDLEPAARAALGWLDQHGDGYIEYLSRNPATGLPNQCWKDSADSIVHPDGTLAARPHAVCEIQGYAYDARRRAARLAREVWGDPALAHRLEADAVALRDRFHRDFWLAEEEFYALALDGAGRPVKTLTSNIGHLLWSGIVPDEHAGAVAGRLLSEPLFSGWGVRTLATGQLPYDPVSYHNGSVWPHDTALAAAGLARYGYHAEAARLATATLEAAAHFGHRLPEVFVGHGRDETTVPVAYPTACSPQAWAAGTPLLLLRVLLDLKPASLPRPDR